MRSPRLEELPEPPRERVGWPWTEDSEQLPPLMPNDIPWPRVSIVTPLYNHEAFIEETIRAVLLQGYPDFEHIIIDGGSTDGSLAVVEKYARWVNCIVRKGEGQSAALNRGFKQATGELVGWQNSDDFYAPNSFREGALAATNHPDCDVFHGTVRGFWGQECRSPWLFEVCEEFSQAAFLDRMCIMNQSMFFRSSIFQRGMLVAEDLHYTMDQEYFWRLSFEKARFCLVPSMMGYYRQHEKAKSLSGRGDMEKYALLRSLCRDGRLDSVIRRKARTMLRNSFISSLRRGKIVTFGKLTPELIRPI